MIPIGDSPRAWITPWVNYALIVANFVVFFYMLSLDAAQLASPAAARAQAPAQAESTCYTFETAPTTIDRFYCRWAFQPREFLDAVKDRPAVPDPQPRAQVFLTLLTSIFMHAGWLHILGNMLFLWVFGDNVEDRLGHLPYLGFYLLAGIFASLTQLAVDVDSVVPNVGASGAIAGVLGAYLVFYPRARVNVVIPFFPLIFIPFGVSAVFMIGLWFVQNLLSGLLTLAAAPGTPDTGIAFFAHVGGFVFGALAAALVFRRVGRAPPRYGPRA